MKKQILPFDPKSEILLWGPTPGRNFYMAGFNESIFFNFPKEYPGYAWPKTLYLLQDGKIFWINDYSDLRKAGIKVFKRYILRKNSRLNLRKNWKNVVKKLDAFERKLDRLNLRRLSDADMQKIGKQFLNIIIDFWTVTVPQELGNYGSDKLLEEKIKKFVPDEANRMEVMETLTTPEEFSFYQKEELELSQAKNLKRHQRKYFWLQNSYNGAKILPISFFAERKEALSKNLGKNLKNRIRFVKLQKKNIQKKYKLSAEVMKIAEGLSFGVAWQDERKGNIFKYVHYLDLFIKEVAKRKNYDISELLDANLEEVINAINQDIRPIIKRRNNCFGYMFTRGNVKELNASFTKEYWKLYGEEKIQKNIKRFSGIVASKGKGIIVSGRVKIVRDPSKAKNFKNGNILVSPFTAPEYLFLMKEASAVITDSGGLTSHAAITSRELGIPCIVGTRIATKVLKDGDIVEVNTKMGTVRIIKKKRG